MTRREWHVALLRGINVGRAKRVAMADLRGIVESLGHRDVATYVQSGNVVLTAADDHAEPAALASALERAIAAGSDVRPDVVVLTRDALARVVANNPYADEDDPKHVHVAFQQGGADDGAAEGSTTSADDGLGTGITICWPCVTLFGFLISGFAASSSSRVKTRARSHIRRAASSPPARRTLTIPPGRRIWRATTS